jgi:hypothetical protein
MLSVIYVECHNAECRVHECRYAECRGARKTFYSTVPVVYLSGVTYSALFYQYVPSLIWKHETRLKILARHKRYSLL